MENYWGIVINKPYVKDLLQDLADNNAIQILEGEQSVAADDYQVPQWQQEETMRRMEEFRKNPHSGVTLEELEKSWDEDEKM